MTLSKGTLFNEHLVKDLINKVKGRSSLAVLANQEPIPFNGQKEFTFELDQDIDIVAEKWSKRAWWSNSCTSNYSTYQS